MIKSQVRPAVVLFLLLTLITGVVYPCVITLIAAVAFPHAAGGNLIKQDGKIVGSVLIGQTFTDPKYFWGRPSATGCNAAASCGSNWGPLAPDLHAQVEERIKALRDADPGNTALVPVDLVTASGSGIDPHISPEAAIYQAARVSKARNMDIAGVEQLIAYYTSERQLGFLGEPRVNVLQLNLALDGAP